MPDDAERYWDDSDDFEVRTVDTAALDDMPSSPATHDNDFSAVTLEPQPTARAAQPALAPPQRRTSATRSQPRHRSRKPTPAWLIALRTILVVTAMAVLVSTIFSLWTRPTFFSDEFRAGLNQVQATQRVISIQPTPLPTETREVRIGIVAGHTGPPQDSSFTEDPGAVCDDGLTERSINEAVAHKVVTALRREGYTVELLQEFDPRLEGFEADVLVSIHSNDCRDYGEGGGNGFAVASAQSRQTTQGKDEYLLNCLTSQYAATTGMPDFPNLTYDMTEYHTFSEVAVDTPTAIVELGFLRNNRDMLTQQQDLLAQGVANGIRCFLHPELYSGITPTQAPQ
jgi:N-acetylmuramoyl-L-alanine amidase